MPASRDVLLPALAVFAVYAGALLLVGTCSTRVRFDNLGGAAGGARVRAGFRWAQYYYWAVCAAGGLAMVLIVVVQVSESVRQMTKDEGQTVDGGYHRRGRTSLVRFWWCCALVLIVCRHF